MLWWKHWVWKTSFLHVNILPTGEKKTILSFFFPAAWTKQSTYSVCVETEQHLDKESSLWGWAQIWKTTRTNSLWAFYWCVFDSCSRSWIGWPLNVGADMKGEKELLQPVAMCFWHTAAEQVNREQTSVQIWALNSTQTAEWFIWSVLITQRGTGSKKRKIV